MSYDFALVAQVDTGTVWELEVWAWDTAPSQLVNLIEKGLDIENAKELEGKTAAEILPLLDKALWAVSELVNANPKAYQGRWWRNEIADYGKGAILFLEELKTACQEHGKATLRVSA